MSARQRGVQAKTATAAYEIKIAGSSEFAAALAIVSADVSAEAAAAEKRRRARNIARVSHFWRGRRGRPLADLAARCRGARDCAAAAAAAAAA